MFSVVLFFFHSDFQISPRSADEIANNEFVQILSQSNFLPLISFYSNTLSNNILMV